MEEQIIGSGAGWTVTTTRVEINGQTFATRNIGSVKVVGDGFPFLGLFFGALAGFMLLIVTNSKTPQPGLGVIALGIGALGIYMIARKSGTRRLVVVTGGGEVVALKSTDSQAIDQLRSAVAQAISQR